ncbi:MAG: enoyl-CoA hydratase [Betaproteobacteria bacterium]|nr:enoyl-CoA hydratase [Betaproteobacteria bacterium]
MNAAAEPMLSPFVLADTREGVRTLTLNRGERYNPLSYDMLAALETAIDEVAADSGVRAVVLAGAGRGFCAGHDLKELRAQRSPQWRRGLFDLCSRVMIKLTQLPQPTIARVHGMATAAGCQLVSMCDLAVAADTARFALPGVNVGVFCSTPAVGVGRNVARKRVMEMLLTGEPIDAATALAWGLVNRVVAIDAIDAGVRQFTDLIVARSASIIAMGKRAFYAQIDASLGDAYAVAGETMCCNLDDPDADEGMDAFIAKRPPDWRTRG